MEKTWKEIDTITKKIYDCYLEMKELEINELKNNSDYINHLYCLKSMFKIESELYNKLNISDLENIIIKMTNNNMHNKTNIDTAVNYYLNDKLDFDIRQINFYELRKYNKIMNEYYTRKNFNDSYLYNCVQGENVEYDQTFELNNRTIYVFDRIGSFEKIKDSALAQIDLNYIDIISEFADQEYTEIKYNLLFVNPNLYEYYFNNKKNKFNNKLSNELYEYFLNYFSNIFSSDIIDTVLDYEDEDLKDEENLIYFFLELIFLKTTAQILSDDEKQEYIDMLTKEIYEKNPNVIYNIMLNINNEEKKEKIKK